jgi:hypothetical protein
MWRWVRPPLDVDFSEIKESVRKLHAVAATKAFSNSADVGLRPIVAHFNLEIVKPSTLSTFVVLPRR